MPVEQLSLEEVLLDASPQDVPLGPTVLVAAPGFVASDDFHLRPDSPAVDFARNLGNANVDLDGEPRGVDERGVPNRFGPVDLGAYELPAGIFTDGFE